MAENLLTSVMYHYVRPIAGSRYPRINGLELTDFVSQLDYIQKHYNVIKPSNVLSALEGTASLPERATLLTFDDGYRDHYVHVYPVLLARGLSAVFFPPTAAIRDRELLDVNRVHFTIASAEIKILVQELEAAVLDAASEFSLLPLAEYRSACRVANRFDGADVIYVKRMLQHVLPESLRSRIARSLFARHVSRDERSFADDLYTNGEELCRMAEGGMEIGSHGHRHYWLGRLEAGAQAKDIDDSLNYLGTLGLRKPNFWFCYPYGSYNADTLRVLRDRGCGAAVTVLADVAECVLENALEIPRLDTNDLPRARDAAPSPWTEKAAVSKAAAKIEKV